MVKFFFTYYVVLFIYVWWIRFSIRQKNFTDVSITVARWTPMSFHRVAVRWSISPCTPSCFRPPFRFRLCNREYDWWCRLTLISSHLQVRVVWMQPTTWVRGTAVRYHLVSHTADYPRVTTNQVRLVVKYWPGQQLPYGRQLQHPASSFR